MRYTRNKAFYVALSGALLAFSGLSQAGAQQAPANVALTNGRWFNGTSFETRAVVYSVKGRFAFTAPARVDQTIDLAGTCVIPPFAEAHNHNITGIEALDRPVIQKYLSDGVFYVKIQGNLPLTEETRGRLSVNGPESVDMVLAQGTLTATGGHPIPLQELLLTQGNYPGHTRATLKDHLSFTIDSEADLDAKWPRVLSNRPDFIKTILLFSEEFEKRKDDPAYAGQKGLDPRLLPQIVAKAHASGLRVTTHVATATDFHYALAAGADEIAHLPAVGEAPIAVEDARLAAMRRTVVITTYLVAVPSLIRVGAAREADVRNRLTANLKVLHENGAAIAIGSDSVSDSSVAEVQSLHASGLFDNLTLLKMWTESTARAIFPSRQIGALREGYEASFLSLDGDPLRDFQNVRRIRHRFKQGVLVQP